MRNKVLLNVVLPATQQSYEFRMPLDLRVEEGARLASRILASREPVRYAASDEADLMALEGEGMGDILSPGEAFRCYVSAGRLVDGSLVALV